MFVYNENLQKEMLIFKADKLYFLSDKEIDDLANAICFAFENKLMEKGLNFYNQNKEKRILSIVDFLMECQRCELEKMFEYLAIKNVYLYAILDKLFNNQYKIHAPEIEHVLSLDGFDALTAFKKHIANFLMDSSKTDNEKLISIINFYNFYYYLSREKEKMVENNRLAFEVYDNHIKFVVSLSLFLRDF